MAKKKKNLNWKKLILELLVVFLGVTGGFVLNNWRESNKNIQLERQYIESFLNNTDSNIVELGETIAIDTLRLNKLNSKIRKMATKTLAVDSFGAVLNIIVYVSKITIHTSTFDDIRYSGNLNLIRDYKLKEKIVAYHNFIESSRYVENYYNSFFSDFTLPFVLNEFDAIGGKFVNYDPKTMVRFFNITTGYYSMLERRTEVFEMLQQKSMKLHEELNIYLQENFK